MILPWHLYLMALLYLLAGLNHFRNPRLYIKIIPSFFKNPKRINQLSGIAEIILAIALCIPALTQYAAWGIILLLIAVFPANIYMFLNKKASLGVPKWILLLRLPLQILLIFWAFHYTQ
ncbi:MAG: DoxX family protein [Flavobacterium sp.]